MGNGLSLIINAAGVAKEAHKDQRRYDGEPYINHPMRVAGMVTLCQIPNEMMIATAWLHDVVEDTHLTPNDLLRWFPACVVQDVIHLTNVFTDDDYFNLSRAERRTAEAERLAGIDSYYVHTIKLADRCDNVHQMLQAKRSRQWAKDYIAETWELIEALAYGDLGLRTTLVARTTKVMKEL